VSQRHRQRSILTTTAAFFAVFFAGTAALEWIVIKQQSFGHAPVWEPFLDRLGYLIPVGILTALVHGGLVELLGWFRRQSGKSAIRRLTMPITAAIAGVLLMAFPKVPEFFTALGGGTLRADHLTEYLVVALGVGVLCTAVAIVFGASGGGLRGRQ
jgi:H+/Cl- antiporter ClcA